MSGIRLHDLAWAAGLFEGEGTVATGGNRGQEVRLGMSDEDVVRRFGEVLGIGIIRRYEPMGLGTKPLWYWRAARFEQVQHVACLFWPWLGERRKRQFADVLLAVRRPTRNVAERERDGVRLCSRCHEWLPTTDFTPGHAMCRLCLNERRRERRRERLCLV